MLKELFKMAILACAIMSVMLIGAVIKGMLAWPIAVAGAAVCAIVAVGGACRV